jgi:hypothetical protein
LTKAKRAIVKPGLCRQATCPPSRTIAGPLLKAPFESWTGLIKPPMGPKFELSRLHINISNPTTTQLFNIKTKGFLYPTLNTLNNTHEPATRKSTPAQHTKYYLLASGFFETIQPSIGQQD